MNLMNQIEGTKFDIRKPGKKRLELQIMKWN